MSDKKPDIFDLGYDRNLNRIDTQRDYEVQTRNRFDEQRKEHESQERIRIQRVATSGKSPLLYTIDIIIEKCLMKSQNEINFFDLGFSGDMAGVAEAKKLFRLLKMEKCFNNFELSHTSARIVFAIQEPDIKKLKEYRIKIKRVFSGKNIPLLYSEIIGDKLNFFPDTGDAIYKKAPWQFPRGTKAYEFLAFLNSNKNTNWKVGDFKKYCNEKINIDAHRFRAEKDTRDTLREIRSRLKVKKGEPFPILKQTKGWIWLEKAKN